MRELPTPGPVDGQVLVRVCAAGVNPFDAYVAGGITLPVLTPITTPERLGEMIEALAPS